MTPRNAPTLGELIRDARKARGWTQAKLAKEIGASSTRRIIDWELHGAVPDEPYATKLSRRFKIPHEMFTPRGATEPLRQEIAKLVDRLRELEAENGSRQAETRDLTTLVAELTLRVERLEGLASADFGTG